LLAANTSPDMAAAWRAFVAILTLGMIAVARIEAAVRGETADA
jgi:hypothetical protein